MVTIQTFLWCWGRDKHTEIYLNLQKNLQYTTERGLRIVGNREADRPRKRNGRRRLQKPEMFRYIEQISQP